ncbi:MAG TPA: hypothetical protein VMD05_06180 [Candidatus Nanoarchaeia archaeon]|nr:hypothetical protein [Candidatus Nanoarchaeia archaeon]
MSEENQDWIFVNRIPLLCEKKRIMRQQKVETWLDLYQLMRELEISKTDLQQLNPPLSYVS